MIFTYIENPEQCLDQSNQLITNKVHEIDNEIKELLKITGRAIGLTMNYHGSYCILISQTQGDFP